MKNKISVEVSQAKGCLVNQKVETFKEKLMNDSPEKEMKELMEDVEDDKAPLASTSDDSI